MKKDKDKEEIPYPEGYEYLRDVVKPYRDDIWKYNDQVDKLAHQQAPQPQKPGLNLNPPGYRMERFKPAVTKEYWERQIDERRDELNKRIEVEIKELDPEDQKSIKDAIRDDVDRNPFHGFSKEELEKHREEEKDLSQSQNYAARLLQLSKEEKNQDKTVEVTPDKEPDQQPEFSPSAQKDRTMRFTQTIENSKDIERDEPIPKKDKDRDWDRE